MLTQLEEEVIVRYILDLDQRGFAPTYAAVRDMAEKLLAARGAGQVGVHWPCNFVKRTDSLKHEVWKDSVQPSWRTVGRPT
jgi:hypothetical protein